MNAAEIVRGTYPQACSARVGKLFQVSASTSSPLVLGKGESEDDAWRMAAVEVHRLQKTWRDALLANIESLERYVFEDLKGELER